MRKRAGGSEGSGEEDREGGITYRGCELVSSVGSSGPVLLETP